MPFPHIQGAFREVLVADTAQCVKADGLSAGETAMGEPLAVALHATGRAGSLLGERVLVSGCGPIGVLAILAARRAGAAEIVAVDLSDFTLQMAAKAGADHVVNTGPNRTDWRDRRATRAILMCSTNVRARLCADRSGFTANSPWGWA